jgi:tryptophanyl-tRNA synthetase
MKATEIPKVLGIDGQQKMSKSLDNHIELAATPEETKTRIMQMVTDPQRIKRTDPGNPDICNVFSMHKIFSPAEEVRMINVECRRAGIGCVDCKTRFADNLNRHLEPFRIKRAEIDTKPHQVWDVLHDGAARAREIAEKTMLEVRKAVQLP